MLTLDHNGKKYYWQRDNWGDVPVKDFELKLDENGRVYLYEYVSASACWYEVKTYHTPEQLITLGYLLEVKENYHWNGSPIVKKDIPLPEFIYDTILDECLEKSRNNKKEYDRFILDALGSQMEKITGYLLSKKNK